MITYTIYNYGLEALKVFDSSHFSEMGTGHNPLLNFGGIVAIVSVCVLVFSIIRNVKLK